MVVEGILKSVGPVPGKIANTFDYVFDDITVVTNLFGDVVTVIPKGST